MKYTESLFIRLEQETMEALKEIAEEQDRAVAYIARKAFHEYIKNHGK